MIGFLFVAAVLARRGLLAFRMIPSYIEYYTSRRRSRTRSTEPEPTLANVRRAFERQDRRDYVDSVTAKDVEVSKWATAITASASWEKKLPLVHNVSLLMEFNASASR
jgi:hypothetical protein